MAKSDSKEFVWSGKNNHDIQPDERDYKLRLHKDNWHETLIGKREWHLYETGNTKLKCPQRILKKNDITKKLKEIIIRFPSAPIYGIHREFKYQMELDRINYHTFRVIQGEDQEGPIEHIYVMLNGLNETDGMSFFYDSALHIIEKNKNVACIIRPFPGHLTRFPLPGLYAEQPLDRYLADSGDLYRQYLRFMIETRWLLSCIVPIRNYPMIVGHDLNVEGKLEEPCTGRAKPDILATDILEEWKDIFTASTETNSEPRRPGQEIENAAILESIQLLRDTMNWKETQGDLTNPPSIRKIVPQIHVFGYSLGGFLAQCLFFSWPFAISTCTTICSGGWLRDLAPTKFSHPEEWQQVLYGLRFEIEDSMLNNRIYRKQIDKLVSGISEDAFSFYTRIFYEVFLQDTQEKYLSRIDELGHRILFVVGGADPIVKTKSLLDASPRGGINMIEVAKLGHFLTHEGSNRESQWTEFWFPTVMNLIVEFSKSAGKVYLESLIQDWNFVGNRNSKCIEEKAETEKSDKDKAEERRKKRKAIKNKILESESFRVALAKIVYDFKEQNSSWLFIARNKPPTVLFGDDAIHVAIPTLHYRDSKWIEYLKSVNHRCNILQSKQKRLSIVMPEDVKTYFLKSKALLPPKHNTHSSVEHKEIWERFEDNWKTARKNEGFDDPCDNPFMFFDLNHGAIESDKVTTFLDLVKKKLKTDSNEIVNVLPDIWLFLGTEAVNDLEDRSGTMTNRERIHTGLLDSATKLLLDEKKIAEEDKIWNFIKDGQIQIVKVSGAEFNPLYRGQLILNPDIANRQIIHCALALCYSKPNELCK